MRTLRYSAALLLMLAVNLPAQTTFYVDSSRIDDSGDGLEEWVRAKKYLQSALASANDGDQIWVAAGIYYPDEGQGATGNDRNSNFAIPSGVKVYGGYPSGGGDRDWAQYPTTLSGDIDHNDDRENTGGNAYTVVTFMDASDQTVLDGFSITGGNKIDDWSSGNGAGGAGIHSSGGSPQIKNCIISGNNGNLWGGGMASSGGNPALTNCIITGNTALLRGGGIYNGSTSLTLTNCTISGNRLTYPIHMIKNTGDGIHAGGSLTLTNCIVWGNAGSNIGPYWGELFITYSNIQSESGQEWLPEIFQHVTNTDSDPLFVMAPPFPGYTNYEEATATTEGNYRVY